MLSEVKISSSLLMGLLLSTSFCPQATACGEEAHAAGSGKSSGAPTFVLSEAGKKTATFQITGMSCQSCERSVSAQLKKIDAVEKVTFKKKGQSGLRLAIVQFKDGKSVDSSLLLQAVEKAGYQASAVE